MFNGYSTETVDFLWGIRFNNNREWFQANKEAYTKYLYHPTKELGAHLFEPFLDTPGVLCKVSRIYRDARLHPPVPSAGRKRRRGAELRLPVLHRRRQGYPGSRFEGYLIT